MPRPQRELRRARLDELAARSPWDPRTWLARFALATSRTQQVATVTLAALVTFGLVELLGVYVVPSASMEPTLRAGDRIALLGGSGELRAGHVVVVDLETAGLEDGAEGPYRVKRVVALAGERIRCCTSTGAISRDGVVISEPYARLDPTTESFDVLVPAAHVFVLGDNRGFSVDSRSYGPVPRAAVEGRVRARIWPPWRLRLLASPPWAIVITVSLASLAGVALRYRTRS